MRLVVRSCRRACGLVRVRLGNPDAVDSSHFADAGKVDPGKVEQRPRRLVAGMAIVDLVFAGAGGALGYSVGGDGLAAVLGMLLGALCGLIVLAGAVGVILRRSDR